MRRTAGAGALIGRGSGEAFQLVFSGQGFVVVQASEGRVVARAQPLMAGYDGRPHRPSAALIPALSATAKCGALDEELQLVEVGTPGQVDQADRWLRAGGVGDDRRTLAG